MKHISMAALLSCVLLLSTCKHEPIVPADGPGTIDPPPPGQVCDPDSIYFQEQVLPIFQSSCAIEGCHDQASSEEGYVFDSYEGIMDSDEIEPGDNDNGKIVDVIQESDPDDVMPPPPNAPLTQGQIQIILDWIDQGALNNSCPDALCDTLDVTFSGSIWPIIESNCEGCHNSVVSQGGVQLQDYDDIKFVADFGMLTGVLNGGSGYPQMPPSGPLSDCQIRMVELWIENGSPND